MSALPQQSGTPRAALSMDIPEEGREEQPAPLGEAGPGIGELGEGSRRPVRVCASPVSARCAACSEEELTRPTPEVPILAVAPTDLAAAALHRVWGSRAVPGLLGPGRRRFRL